jgi:putative ABC transport system permease protein
VGSAGSWYLAGAVRSFLFGLEATDVRGFVVAALALSLAGLSACLVPAWRAATVDPTVALRNE